MRGWQRGDSVWFKPDHGARRRGTVEAVPPVIPQVLVLLEGDPFPVNVRSDQLSACNESRKSVDRMTNHASRQGKDTEVSKKDKRAKKEEAKELAMEAKGLGIEGYEDMSLKKLRKAVEKAKAKPVKAKTAKKPAAKKAPAKKVAAKKAAAKKPAAAPKSAKKTTGKNKGGGSKKGSRQRPIMPFGTNPFREGTALFHMFPMLLKGGKRRTIAARLSKKVGINPYADNKDVTEADYDERVRLGANQMELLGYEIVRTGRGLDGTIKVVIPEGMEGKTLTRKQLDAHARKVKAAGQKKPNTTTRPGGKRSGTPKPAKTKTTKKAPAKKAAAKKTAAKKPAKKAPAKKAAAKKKTSPKR